MAFATAMQMSQGAVDTLNIRICRIADSAEHACGLGAWGRFSSNT